MEECTNEELVGLHLTEALNMPGVRSSPTRECNLSPAREEEAAAPAAAATCARSRWVAARMDGSVEGVVEEGGEVLATASSMIT